MIIVSALLIVNVAVIRPDLKFAFDAWNAVIVTFPVCKIVTVDPDILAMVGSELSYEISPVLLDVGVINVNVPPSKYGVEPGAA